MTGPVTDVRHPSLLPGDTSESSSRDGGLGLSSDQASLEVELAALLAHTARVLGESTASWLFASAWLRSRGGQPAMLENGSIDVTEAAHAIATSADPTSAASSLSRALSANLTLAAGPAFVRRSRSAARSSVTSAVRSNEHGRSMSRIVLAATDALSTFDSVDRALPGLISAIDSTLPVRTVALVESTGPSDARLTLFHRDHCHAAELLEADTSAREAWRLLTQCDSLHDVTVTHVPITSTSTPDARNAAEAQTRPTALCLPLIRSRHCVGLLRLELDCAPSDEELTALVATAGSLAMALASSERPSIVGDVRVAAIERSHRELLSVVSHDLRNPLSAILMSVSLMLRARQSGARAESVKSIEVIKRSAERLNLLIQNVVDASHLEHAALPLNASSVPAAEIVGDAVRMLEAQAANRAVRLTVDIGNDVTLVQCDRERVVQTLANVLHASLRFTPKEGSVMVSARKTEPHRVKFEIRDSSPGFDVSEARKMFDRTWWAERNQSLGTGLGLAVARGIVEAHGSHLTLESTPGIGNVFAFELRCDD